VHSIGQLLRLYNISKVSLPVLPYLTQNLMNTLCSSTSAIPQISENRRRLMQYTHKDTCNNETLPHPTTPLGTLTHKTPPQHTLAGNSWTTSNLRVMSIVLGLWIHFRIEMRGQQKIKSYSMLATEGSQSTCLTGRLPDRCFGIPWKYVIIVPQWISCI